MTCLIKLVALLIGLKSKKLHFPSPKYCLYKSFFYKTRRKELAGEKSPLHTGVMKDASAWNFPGIQSVASQAFHWQFTLFSEMDIAAESALRV